MNVFRDIGLALEQELTTLVPSTEQVINDTYPPPESGSSTDSSFDHTEAAIVAMQNQQRRESEFDAELASRRESGLGPNPNPNPNPSEGPHHRDFAVPPHSTGAGSGAGSSRPRAGVSSGGGIHGEGSLNEDSALCAFVVDDDK